MSKDGKSITYRSLTEPKEVHVKMVKNNIDTMEKVFNLVVKEFGDHKCLGTREILAEEDEVQDNGRVFKKVSNLSSAILFEYRLNCFKQYNI